MSQEFRQERRHKVLGKQVVAAGGYAAAAFIGVKLTVNLVRGIGRLLQAGNPKALSRNQSLRQKSLKASGNETQSVGQQQATPSGGEDCWQVVESSCPPVPSGYKEICSATLPVSVEGFYSYVVSGASGFTMQQHVEVGKQYNLSMGPWLALPADQPGTLPPSLLSDGSLLGPQSVFEYVLGVTTPGGFMRSFTFVNPKKGPQPNDTRVVQRHQFCVFQGQQLLLTIAACMLDIPYKDCFTVNTIWLARPAADGAPGRCDVTMYLKVHFIKPVMVAPIIRSMSFKESAAFFRDFMENAGRMLQNPPPLPLPSSANTTSPSSHTASSTSSSLSNAKQQPSSSPFPLHAGSPPPSASLQLGSSSSRRGWAHHLRVLLVFLLLLGCLLHQLWLRREVAELRGQLMQLQGQGQGHSC